MSLPDDLLKHARRLAEVDARRPKQVSLRRAVPASYYALFHLLTSSAASLFVNDGALRAKIGRGFNHGELRRVSTLIANGKWPKNIGSPTSPRAANSELKFVANAFVALQQARHEADYNLTQSYGRKEALVVMRRARDAFECWDKIKKTDDARLYLACFLLYAT